MRPGGGEVEELLAVDRGEGAGVQGRGQVLRGGRGGVAGVAPALERGDQHRPPELRLLIPRDQFHPLDRTRQPPQRGPGPYPEGPMAGVLDRFSPPTRAWFESTFAAPTAAQEQGWDAISQGEHALILAPTGSGKTLAAFLWVLDRLLTHPVEAPRCRALYISPLKALSYDVEKNLRAPLAGIAVQQDKLGLPPSMLRVATRTGDTPQEDRRVIARKPPDILITTPESLYLMLTSQAREVLRSVEYVIVDEIHAVAPTKRGTHLALSLERLEQLCEKPPQRIGLSATQRPLDELARFLGGRAA